MKQAGRFAGLLAGSAVLAVVALMAATAQAQTQEGVARVMTVRGEADYSEGGGTWSKLSGGRVLNPGAVIRSADGSEVDLDLRKNGPSCRVMPNTTLGITVLRYEDSGVETVIDTQLDLKAGRILGEVDKMAAASKYEVKTPNSVVGIRGATKYDISANGKVVILEGWAMVVFVDAAGKTTTYRVEAGQTFDPTTKAVRQSSQEETDDAKKNMPPRPGPGAVVAKDLHREPFVSTVAPADAAEGKYNGNHHEY